MSKATNAAREQLDAWEARKPEDYTSKYKDRIDGVMGQLDGMKDFSYDPTRDAAYEQYKNSYTRQAKLGQRERSGQRQRHLGRVRLELCTRRARAPTKTPGRA